MITQPGVLLLSASYFCMNYVFFIFAQWLFIRIWSRRRGFSALETWLSLCAAVRGRCCAPRSLAERFPMRPAGVSVRSGLPVPAMFGLVLVAILLMVRGVRAQSLRRRGIAGVVLPVRRSSPTRSTGPRYVSWRSEHCLGDRHDEHRRQSRGISRPGGRHGPRSIGWLPTLATGSVFALVAALLGLFVRAESTTTARDDQLRAEPAGADRV